MVNVCMSSAVDYAVPKFITVRDPLNGPPAVQTHSKLPSEHAWTLSILSLPRSEA